jgi:hypothetical protein
MDDESVVRAAWESVNISFDKELGKFIFFTSNALYRSVFGDTVEELMERGARFTEARQEEVRLLDEEIAVIQTIVDSYVSHGGATFKRTLQRLRDIRAQLTKGMKGAAHGH